MEPASSDLKITPSLETEPQRHYALWKLAVIDTAQGLCPDFYANGMNTPGVAYTNLEWNALNPPNAGVAVVRPIPADPGNLPNNSVGWKIVQHRDRTDLFRAHNKAYTAL